MGASFLVVHGQVQEASNVIHVVAERFTDLSARLGEMRDHEDAIVGDGSYARSLTHIDHIVAASRLALSRPDSSFRLRNGELRSREHVVDGLTAAPAALEMLFDGRNTGKLLVRVGQS